MNKAQHILLTVPLLIFPLSVSSKPVKNPYDVLLRTTERAYNPYFAFNASKDASTTAIYTTYIPLETLSYQELSYGIRFFNNKSNHAEVSFIQATPSLYLSFKTNFNFKNYNNYFYGIYFGKRNASTFRKKDGLFPISIFFTYGGYITQSSDTSTSKIVPGVFVESESVYHPLAPLYIKYALKLTIPIIKSKVCYCNSSIETNSIATKLSLSYCHRNIDIALYVGLEKNLGFDCSSKNIGMNFSYTY